MSASTVEGAPQAALGVLLDMFYGLSVLQQVQALADSKGAQAAAPVELSEEQLGPAVTACRKNAGVPGLLSVKKLQALHSAGTAVSKVQSVEGELYPSFPAEIIESQNSLGWKGP